MSDDDVRREVRQELAECFKGVAAIIESAQLSQEQLDRLRVACNENIDRAAIRLKAITRGFETAPRPAPSISRRR